MESKSIEQQANELSTEELARRLVINKTAISSLYDIQEILLNEFLKRPDAGQRRFEINGENYELVDHFSTNNRYFHATATNRFDLCLSKKQKK